MNTIVFSVFAFIATLLGGYASIKLKNQLNLVLGFAAGIILGLISFDILPEIFELAYEIKIESRVVMIVFVLGFMLFHLLEKYLLVHHNQEENYGKHDHHISGKFSAIAFATHSFFDGIGIGLGFQISATVGLMMAIAIIGHRFTDGFNTGALMLMDKHQNNKTLIYVLLVSIAPFFGALSTLFFTFSETFLLYYLGFFAGSLLYICLEDILPQAHSKSHSLKPYFMTTFGLAFIYVVTLFV